MGKRIATILTSFLFAIGLFGQIPENWSVQTSAVTVAEETGAFTDGAKSLKATWYSTSNQDVDSDAFSVTSEAAYTFSFDVYDSTAAGRVRMVLVWDTGNEYMAEYSADTDAWQTMTHTGTVPTGATTASVRLRFYDESAFVDSAVLFIDDVQYVEDGGSNLVVNGSFESWVAPPEPTPYTIAEIQTPTDPETSDASPYVDEYVETSGVVTATVSSGYFVQDGTDPYSGIYVYGYGHPAVVGDDVTIAATVDEYNGMTELTNVTDYTVNSSGNALPAAIAITTVELDEQYESMLVAVSDAVCTNPDMGNGEWEVDDGSGAMVVDDMLYAFVPTLDNHYDVTGVGYYSYGSFKLEPRDADDILDVTPPPPLPPPDFVVHDFETDIGNFEQPNYSGSTNVDPSSSFAISTEAAHTGSSSGKLTLINDADPADGWFVRLSDRVTEFNADDRVGFWIKGTNTNVSVRWVIYDNGTGGDGYEAGPYHQITAGDEWQYVELDLARDPVVGWITGTGEINSTDVVHLESLQFTTAVEEDAILYIDDMIAIPHNGSIVHEDFEVGIGDFADPNFSGSTSGVLAESAFESSTEEAFEGTASGKMTLVDDAGVSGGWFVRTNNRTTQFAPDSKINIYVKGADPTTQIRLVIWDNGAGGDGYEASQWFSFTENEDNWGVVNVDLARDLVTSWLTGTGEINSTDYVTLESIQLQSAVDVSDTLYFDLFEEIPATQILPYANVTLRAQIGGDAQYRSFWANGSWDNEGVYNSDWTGPMVELTDPDADGIFEGTVALVADGTTYSWWVGSENDGNAWLEDGADITVSTTDPMESALTVVDPSDSGYNDWIISLTGDMNDWDNAADNLTRVGDTWTGAFPLTSGTAYGYKFTVMHSWTAAYGDGGIGGAGTDYSFTPTQDGDYTFTFNDADNSVNVEQAFVWPLVETFTDSVFDLNWAFNGMSGDGTFEIADSTASGWGSDVGVFTDAGYTGIVYLDNVLGADWSVSSDVFLVGPADPDAPLYQGIVAKTDATDLEYYRFIYRNSSASDNGQLKLQGYDGSWHISAAWNPGVDFEPIETGWHNLKIKVIGNDFFAFLDGKMLPGCPFQDEAPFMDAGYPGAYVYNTANGQTIFDNFTVDQGAYPPLAKAGADQFVLVDMEVALDGMIENAQEGNTAHWVQVSGPEVVLSDTTALNATFTPTEAGEYVFRLIVDAGPEFGHTDDVMISVNADFIVPQYTAEYFGDVRASVIDQNTGGIYMVNTSPRSIHYFAPGNETGTPDDTLVWAGIDGWLGPYGMDMADDGMLYLATYSSGNHVWRLDGYGSAPEAIYTHNASSRGLFARGAGENTEVYLMGNGNEIVKITPSGDEWTAETIIANSGDNASMALIGDDIYTVSFSDSISKWVDSGSGYENVPFHTSEEVHMAQFVRPGADPNQLYVMYSTRPVDTLTYFDTHIGVLDMASGEVAYSIQLSDTSTYLYSWARPYTMDVVDGFNIAWGVGPTGNNAVEPAYPQGTYRGYLLDSTGDPGNRAPGARVAVKPGNEVIFGNMIYLFGDRSGDIDGEPITYQWTQTAGPTVEGLDLTAANLEFQALNAGDYTFQLEVSDGVNTSAPAVVDFTVMPVSFVEEFETDADVANWTVGNETNMTVSINDTMGLNESGALDLASNLGFAISSFTRGLYAQPGEYFSLEVWVNFVSPGGLDPTSLTLTLDGLTAEPMVVDLNQADFIGQYGHVMLDGFATGDAGNLTIAGVLPFQPGTYQHIYLDSLAWTNPATVTTYDISGTITTNDSGDPTGTTIQVEPYEEYWSTDVADNTGAYSITGIVPGTYLVTAHLYGYKNLDTLVTVDDNLILDLELIRNTPPVAVAPTIPASNQVSAFVLFDGSGCYDDDGDELTYYWSGPDSINIQLFSSGNGGFRPSATGTYSFSLFVSDGVDSSETVTFDVNVDQAAPAPERPLTYVDEFIEEGSGWQGLAVDADSKLWSTAYYSWTPNVRVWDADGVPATIDNISSVVVDGDTLTLDFNNHGRDVNLDPDGNVWVSGGGYVAGFDAVTGEQIGAVAKEGSAVFSFDGDGNLYVGAVVSNVIYKYDTNLELVRSDTMARGAVGRDFAVAPDGSRIIVGELSNKAYILERQADGSYLQVDDLPGPFISGEQISHVKFDSEGFLYLMGETNNIVGDDRLYIYNPNTDYATREVVELTGTNSPRGMAYDANLGVFYVADFATAEVTIGRYAMPGANLITSLYTAAADDAAGEPAYADSVVTVRGYVSTTNELGGPAYIQAWDGSAGMAVYDSDFHNAEDLARGQYVEITGSIGFYNGLTEITNVAADGWSILVDELPEVAPLMVTAADLLDNAGEALEGVLVSIDSLSLVDPGEWPAEGSHATVHVTDGVDTIEVRIDRDTNIDGNGAPADDYFMVTGVVGQYDGSSPYFSGYQLMPRDIDDFHGAVVSVDDNLGLPKEFALHQNYPNPFNASTTIKYELPRDARIKLVLYNMLGQQVATLVDEHQTAGYRTIQWNGRNDFGQNVASGLYIMRITADKNAFTQTRKMTIIK
ncbi:MAG: T9SS type A sorting domain-containing protein [Candidatus Marinimicrobia bacterium]|nr:T9SS type A sorting domain-containing protein [Candidatus Neomarinimicrobiota bacterium]MCF7839949.1 T9SS type A sorting domain-containing protein [Candidatus Neomarinimicrobiota bacterium]